MVCCVVITGPEEEVADGRVVVAEREEEAATI